MNDNEIIGTIGELRSQIGCLCGAAIIILESNGTSDADGLVDRDRVAYNVIMDIVSELSAIVRRIDEELIEFKKRSGGC